MRPHLKAPRASVSLQGARAATHKPNPRGTRCARSPRNPGRSPENTRARTPAGDVNKRAHTVLGAAPGTVLTESRTSTPRPRPGFLPGPRAPPRPLGEQTLRGSRGRGPTRGPGTTRSAHSASRSPSPTRPYRPLPGPALGARWSRLSRWRSRVTLEPRSSPIATAVPWEPAPLRAPPFRVLLWGGRRAGGRSRAQL